MIASAGLAAALTRAMDEGAGSSQALPEWFVGVGGSPEGPLTPAGLKERIAAGVVTPSTLVWKEGFEDWRPLSSFPELMLLLEESRSSAAPLLGLAVASLAANAAQPEVPVGAGGVSASPVTASAATEDDDLGFGALGFGQPRPLMARPQAVAAPREPLASIAPITGSEGVVREAPLSEAPAPAPRGMSAGRAWFAVVAALALGVTIGVVVLGGQKEVVKYVEVPAQPGEPKAATAEPTSTAATAEEATEQPDGGAVATQVAGMNPRVAGTPASAAPPVASAAETKGGGLAGLQGLKDGPSGPSGPAGSSGGATKAASGQPLDSASVQRVVSTYTASVRRSCWQPALSTRDADAPSTARVSVTIQVAPSGSVSSVSTSGDPKGYRGLSSCIAARVRGWQFPPASGSTTVNVPFVFATQ